MKLFIYKLAIISLLVLPLFSAIHISAFEIIVDNPDEDINIEYVDDTTLPSIPVPNLNTDPINVIIDDVGNETETIDFVDSDSTFTISPDTDLITSPDEIVLIVTPVVSPTDKKQCKKDRWKTFTSPSFKNQSKCMSYVNKHL